MSNFRRVLCIVWLFLLIGVSISCCSNRYSDNRQRSKKPVAWMDGAMKVCPNALQIPKYQDGETIKEYFAYTVSFNHATLNPTWVAYELSANHTDGPCSRKGLRFVQDPNCLWPQAEDADYKGSGYSRGHLVPAGDMKWDSVAMRECFYFTNCIPQDTKFNNGKWNQLEERTRRLAKEYGTVYVVCGPVYEQRDTIRIGANGVAVPHKCFKALMVPKEDSYSAIGFIMSNGGEEREVMDCACTVDSLEMVVGIDLFCNLPDKLEKNVESTVVWEDW